MKTVKNFTTGLALALCVLMCIYVLTLYLKFEPKEPTQNPDGTVEEVPGKIEQFLDSDIKVTEHIDLIFVLAVSAAAGFMLDKMPAFGMLTSAGALGYVLTMIRFEALPEFPRTVMIFSIAHAAGTILYAATSERGKERSLLKMNSAASGGMLCNLAALCITLSLCPVVYRLSQYAEKLEELEENGLIVGTKFAIIPGFVDMVFQAFERHGLDKARLLTHRMGRWYETKGIAEEIEMSFVGEEYTVYFRLALMLFAVIVLSLVFKKRAIVGAVLSAVPPLYIFGNIMYDKISTMTLVLLTFTLMGAVGAFAAYQREGAPSLVDAFGEELEIEEDDDPLPDEIPASDAEDDTEGELISDDECARLDYFYEKPLPDLSAEQMDEYLELNEENDTQSTEVL